MPIQFFFKAENLEITPLAGPSGHSPLAGQDLDRTIEIDSSSQDDAAGEEPMVPVGRKANPGR